MAKFTANNKKRLLVISVTLVVLLIVLLVFNFSRPERSTASFCKEYNKQLAQLPATGGDGYKVTVFPKKTSSDPKVFKNTFSALADVAPKDIEPDVVALRKVFESIDKDPANAVNASLGGLSAESNVTKYVESNCK